VLCFVGWLLAKGERDSRLNARIMAVGRDTNGAVSALCSLENTGRRGLSVWCAYYEIKAQKGWSPRDEYGFQGWYIPARGSQTICFPAPHVTNHWRVRFQYTVPRTNYNAVEQWAEDFCVSRLRRFSPLTPRKMAVTAEIE
jgi:hypothetical protein